jgi:predicted DNA-binding antitoxin AbrB/MazE fold protein
MTVRAVYENGVFRPREAVSLPEHTEVELEIARSKKAGAGKGAVEAMDRVYAALGVTFEDPSSPGNLAERHNEHQP